MVTDKIRIRTAADADLPFLGPIEAAGDAQFPAGRFPGLPGSDNVPESELRAGISDRLLWVAESLSGNSKIGGTLRGFQLAAVYPIAGGDPYLHLRQRVVHPEWQRQGIGSAFIRLLFNEARSRGACRVSLTTFSDIPWNAPVYEKFGFQIGAEDRLPDFLRHELEDERAAGMVNRVAMFTECLVPWAEPLPN